MKDLQSKLEGHLSALGKSYYNSVTSLNEECIQEIRPDKYTAMEVLCLDSAVSRLRDLVRHKKSQLDAAKKFLSDIDSKIDEE